MTDVAVVGAGQVVSRCMSRGLAGAGGLKVRWVFDPVARVSPLEGAALIRVPEAVDTACEVITAVLAPKTPVIIATPTALHTAYGLRLSGRPVAIEKPLATSLRSWDGFAAARGDWFPLSYYLLEKGLPLLLAARPQLRSSASMARVTGSIPTLKRPIISLHGCIIESRGASSAVLDRPWVLEQGGHVWDTFFHLTCLLAACTEGDRWHELEVQLGRLDGLTQGNTACAVRGRVGGVQVSLVAMKGGTAAEHQRWLDVVTADGERWRMDLERQCLGGACLRQTAPYATQLRLFEAWLGDRSSVALPMDILRRAVALNEAVAGAAVTVQSYEPGASAAAVFSHVAL